MEKPVFKSILRNILFLILGLCLTKLVVNASPFEYKICNLGWKHVHHEYHEIDYQKIWCKLHNGIEEYENDDFTRVDCLTQTHAVEFDFANKWQESIGQALHYGIKTGKKPKVVLILDNPKLQWMYYKRVEAIGKKYSIDTEYVTNSILKFEGNKQAR